MWGRNDEVLSNSVLRHRKLVWVVEGPGSLFLRSLKAELSPTGMLTSQGSDMTATDPETCCYWNLMNVNTSPGGGWPSQGICQHRSPSEARNTATLFPGSWCSCQPSRTFCPSLCVHLVSCHSSFPLHIDSRLWSWSGPHSLSWLCVRLPTRHQDCATVP